MEQNETACEDLIIDGYNAVSLRVKFEQAAHSGKGYALVYMNIKNFRFYNAEYGYQCGNEILKLVYQRMVDYVGDRGLVAHLFADHFAVFIHYDDIDTLIYKEWTQLIDSLYRIDYPYIYRELFLSFGFYLLEDDEKRCFQDALNLANLSRKSSASLYKRCHNIEIYEKKLVQTYIDHHHLEIKTAQAYKDYEFAVYLQPKVDVKTKKISGAEALLRWIDKDGNYIPVCDFLPILDENGYIVLVDLDTFDIVLKMLSENIAAGLPVVPISFNISRASFYDPEMIHDYMKIYDKYKIPKHLIEFELMESISLDDTERLKQVVGGFRELGFHCMLDDFGSGYSSFSVLLNAELTAVKMDRQFFLENLNGDNKFIIQSVVNLIKSLHMDVVAEGVETKEYVDFLQECGCDQIQGYYFYKPMLIEEFNHELQKQEKSPAELEVGADRK